MNEMIKLLCQIHNLTEKELKERAQYYFDMLVRIEQMKKENPELAKIMQMENKDE